jgi:hydroxymethylbilane synthase
VPLDPEHECTPAPAQGAVAIDCRAGDRRTRWLVAALHHQQTATAIGIERSVLAGLSGGCSLPLGCHARRVGGRWTLRVRLGGATGLSEATLSGAAAGLAAQALAILPRERLVEAT